MSSLKIKLKKESIFLYGGNLFFRGTTIGARFLFTLFISKEFSTEVLGQYSLFATSILIFYFLLSLSFDSYSLRELLQKQEREQPAYLISHFTFYFISFLVFVPIVVGFFLMGFLPFDLLPYFLILLALETLNQTFYSLFTMIQMSITANIVLFLNQGLWILCILLLFFIEPEILSFETFLLAWISGSFASVIYAFVQLKRKYLHFVVSKIDWIWIRNGIYVSLIFFFSTISYKTIEFIDRYLIERALDISHVGVYAFYYQVANLISAAINVTVIIIQYPKLITCSLNHDYNGFLLVRRKMYLRVLTMGGVLAIFEFFFIQLLLQWLNKRDFEVEIVTFYILIGSNIMMNLSFIPHYCLYALRKDRILLMTTLSGALINIISNFILIPKIGIAGAAVSALIGFTYVWISKSWYLKQNLKLIDQRNIAEWISK